MQNSVRFSAFLITVTSAITMPLMAAQEAKSFYDSTQLCQKVHFGGHYRSMDSQSYAKGSQDLFIVQKNGCHLQIKERGTPWDTRPQTVWNVDLSGTENTTVPLLTLQANEMSSLGYESLKSLQINTKLSPVTGSYYFSGATIQIHSTMHLPVAEQNKIATDLEINGQMAMWLEQTNKDQYTATSMWFSYLKVRVTAVELPAYSSLMSKYFIEGANYILGFLDNLNTLPAVLPNLQNYQRMSKP